VCADFTDYISWFNLFATMKIIGSNVSVVRRAVSRTHQPIVGRSAVGSERLEHLAVTVEEESLYSSLAEYCIVVNGYELTPDVTSMTENLKSGIF
jgi:hypothetical protein